MPDKSEGQCSDPVEITFEMIEAWHQLTPPCIYLFPRTVASVRNNPNPEPHKLENVAFFNAINQCFGGYFDEINNVRFLVAHKGCETVRTTSIKRAHALQHESMAQAIRRN